MILNGTNVSQRQGIWQQVINFAICLSPFFVTVFLQIQGHCGRSLLIIFVMTLLATLPGCALEKTPLLKRLGIMASLLSSNFSLLLARLSKISKACHR